MPWESVVGRRNMQTLFHEEFKPKISGLLADWKPEKDNVLDLIKPWQDTLSRADLEAFCTRYITPRLSYSLSKLEVDPSD